MGSAGGAVQGGSEFEIGPERVAGAEGFEPSALGFGDRCSDQTELRPYRPMPNSTHWTNYVRLAQRARNPGRAQVRLAPKARNPVKSHDMARGNLPVLIVGDVHGDLERLFQALK